MDDEPNSTMDGVMQQLTSVFSMLGANWAQYLIILFAGLFLGKTVKDTVQERSRKKRDASLAASTIAEVRKERDDAVEWARKESLSVDSALRTKIEKMNFKTLREALQSGAVSAESVLRVYFGLAVKAHLTTNCLTGVIKESLTQAKKMDEDAKNPDYKKTALWGIPLSVKEAIMVQGHRCTWGLEAYIDVRPPEDQFPIMKLRADGMIPFVQTNVPTSCLTFISDNAIFGSTCNPHDSSRTCGGSSGGEGALIGGLGSIVGIGSDIGGSIRIPSAYSGCCGFKPSATRFSLLQYPEPIPMRPILTPTEGPLAQDPHAIVEIMRSIWSDHFISNKDPLAVPVDFREDLFKEGKVYRIGYYTSDGYIDPLPGNQRVVIEAAELLKSKGHTLVPFSLSDLANEMAKGVFATIFADGGKNLAATLNAEKHLPPSIEPIREFANMSWFMKVVWGWFFGYIMKDKHTSDMFSYMSRKSVDVSAGINRVYAVRKLLVQKMKDENIDLILCPSTISPALPLSPPPSKLPWTCLLATFMWNACDFPAGIVTIGKWNEKDERDLDGYPTVKGVVEKAIKEGSKNSVGLPLSVQLVAPPFRDEIVLRAMVDLFDAKKGQ